MKITVYIAVWLFTTDVLVNETVCNAEAVAMVRIMGREAGRISTDCDTELNVLILKLRVGLLLPGLLKLL